MRTCITVLLAGCLCLLSTGFARAPDLYQRVAARHDLSAEALYAFALGQSRRQSNAQTVPWPWTVLVDGKRYQFRSRIELFNYLLANRDNANLRFGFDNRALRYQDRTTLWTELEPEAMLARTASAIAVRAAAFPDAGSKEALPASESSSSAVGSSITIPAHLTPLVVQVAREVGIDERLLFAVIHQESRYKANATSRKGAMGLMQLMPDTARALGLRESEFYDPYINLHGGARYLKQQLQDFGSLSLALAAYNAGPGAVRKYGGIPPYRETQDYVARITANYRLLGGGLP